MVKVVFRGDTEGRKEEIRDFKRDTEGEEMIQQKLPAMSEKVFTGFLLLDWKTGHMKVMKRKPKSFAPVIIPIALQLKVLIPVQQEMIAKGEIELSQSKVNELVLESL